ncbi:hypothetical protein C0992_003722 [Termitomyces sp. T32_za158]|nr:hypothetical protein C0992_003722 [Termitomyces sp. T32_za158]
MLQPLSAAPVPSQSKSPSPATLFLGFRLDRLLSMARALFQHAQINYAVSSLPPKNRPDLTYKLFNTDDETYPETEFTGVLSSSVFTTDVKEALVRLLNFIGLTLVLLALLSQ